MGEEKRHEMMETIFGEDFVESEDEQDVAPRSRVRSASGSPAGSDDDEGEGEGEGEGEADGDVEVEGEGEGEVEAEGLVESEGERVGSDAEREQSDAERAQSDGEREESEGERDEGSDGEREGYREAESEPGRDEPEASASGSEQSNRNRREEAEDDEGAEEEARESSERGGRRQRSGEVAEARAVFGDSDEEEEVEKVRRGRRRRPLSDDEGEQEEPAPDDVVADDDDDGYREEPQFDRRRERPVGEPLDLEIPLRQPPCRPDQMNLVRVSNIMGIEPKPFDPKTYEEEATTFVTDESGRKQRLRLEENVARWRAIKNRNGSLTFESNARFVKWSDGSLQLLLGNEVLDIAVQDSRHDQSHLFLRHPKGILQSQGRLGRKMKFMPSSLTSKSHKLLTALVDSRHKKVFKVKNVYTTKDPEKEKVEKERAAEQRIRSKEDLQRKQDKVKSKYTPIHRERDAQLSPNYLEVALDEDEETDEFADGRRAVDARRFREQLEAEGRAERRMMGSRRPPPAVREAPPRSMKNRRPPALSRREAMDSYSEESDREPSYKSEGDEDGYPAAEEVDEEDWQERPKYREERRREDRDDDRRKRKREKEEEARREASPPKKTAQRRRVVVSSDDEN